MIWLVLSPFFLLLSMDPSKQMVNYSISLILICQDEKQILDSVTAPIANSYEIRSETLQPPAVTVQNVVGPTSSRPLMPSQSMHLN